MKFQYYRYFLNSIEQLPGFKDNGGMNKNEILRNILKENTEFKNGRSEMVYIQQSEFEGFIIGKIGRKSSIKRSLPKQNDFEEEIETHYPNCNIIFFTGTNPNHGQRIAFEYDTRVFQSPENQIEAFEKAINPKLFSYGYSLSISPIFDIKEFWNIIESHRGRVEKLTFSYAVPNLFGLEDELSDELKGARRKYGATNAEIVFENKNGQLIVPKEDELIKQSAEYTSRGGGEFKIKVKGVQTEIKSGQRVKTKQIENVELSGNNSDDLKEILKTIFK